MSDFNEQFYSLDNKIKLQDFIPKNIYLYLKRNDLNFYIIETLYFIIDENHIMVEFEHCRNVKEILENINRFTC